MDHHPHHHQQYHPSHGHPAQQHQGGAKHPHHRNNENFNRNSSGRKSDKDAKRAPKTPGPGQPATSNKQSSVGVSVQDRLNRNRVVNIDRNDNSIKVSTSNNGSDIASQSQPKANATLKTISKIIEKNAEIDEKLARQMHQENEKMANRMKELRMQDGA